MGHSVDGQQRDLTSTPTLVGKGPPGRLTTEHFYFRRVGRPAGPTGRPSAYVGVRRTKKCGNKTNSCWSNEEAVCRHWYPKGGGSVWADNTDGMTVSKSTNSKTPYSTPLRVSSLSSLVQRNAETIKQTNKILDTPNSRKNSRGTLTLSWKGLLVSDFSNGHCQKDKMLLVNSSNSDLKILLFNYFISRVQKISLFIEFAFAASTIF